MPPSDAPAGDRPRLVLGLGLSVGAEPAAAITLAEAAIARTGLLHPHISIVATIASRRDHPALATVAAHFHCGIRTFEVGALEAETPRLKNPSEALFQRIGCHGVAEAAALAAAGAQSVLIVEKMTGSHVTVAIAMEVAVF